MLLEYSLTPDDYFAFNQHAVRTSPTIRKQQAQFRMFTAVACLALSLMLIGFVFSDWIGALVVGVITAAVMWFVYPKLNWWLVMRNLRKLVANGAAGPIGPVRLTLGEAGITEELSGTATSVTWDGIDRVTESDGHYFVFTAPLAGMILPKRAPDSAEFIAATRAQIAAAS